MHGSGRTDAGVHALAQVAHCDVPESVRMNAEAWANALNACLPLTIRIAKAEDAEPQAFHARFDAVGKTYRYRIWRPHLLSPFEAERLAHLRPAGHGRTPLVLLQGRRHAQFRPPFSQPWRHP